MDFIPHSDKQERALFSDYPITILSTGIQYGKTRVGAWGTKRKTHQFNSSSDNFIVVAPTYKIMEQSSLPAFKEVFGYPERYNSGKAEYDILGGGKVYFRTATDPDSIVGITNVRFIWGDEAGKFPRYFWDNIEGRAAFMNCPILMTTSPYSMNWMYRDLIKPSQKGLRDDVLHISAASIENPYFPKEVYHRRKENMDPRRFNMMYGGQFGKMEGLVYDCLDDEDNYYERANFPMGTKFYGGVDWGYTDPFVLQVRAITPNGMHYQVSEFYKTAMRLPDIVSLCKKKMQVYSIKTFFCDPSQPGYIDELCANGCPSVGANNDIMKGVDLHYELIKTRRFKMLVGSSKLSESEYDSYHFPEPTDLKPDQNARVDKPVDQDNHSMDAARYITIETHNKHKIRQPSVNDGMSIRRPRDESTLDYSRRIRRNKSYDQTEKWS